MENGFWSLNEVLDFAIAREVEANAFYTEMAARVDRPEMRKVFEDFAREEQGHKTKLEAVKWGEYLFESQAGPAQGLGLAEYLVAGDLTPEMSYADALILAMKKEKASYKLYLDLAALAEDEATVGHGSGATYKRSVRGKGVAMRHSGMAACGWLCLAISFGNDLHAGEPAQGKKEVVVETFRDEPAAHALYNQMIEALRQPQTLSYKSEYWWESRGEEIGRCTYRVWLKKPNYFRVETVGADGKKGGTIVGDGDWLWLFWLGDRPHFNIEEQDSYDKTRSNVYMKESTPPARHSIGHKTGLLGAGMSMPILDPSTFHGYTDSLQRYVDGVKGMGSEYVNEDEDCDVIEVSIMKHQRSWYLWLSKKDHLPRGLKEVIRVSHDITVHETWSDIVINGDIPTDRFVWTPPEGWRQWEMPKLGDILLKPGTPAPDFELASVDGRKIKLSDYRDKIVWFYIWRAG